MSTIHVCIFQSEKYGDLFGFTADASGSNLPAEFAPWKAYGGQAIPAGVAAFEAIRLEIARRGYFIGCFGCPADRDGNRIN